QGRDGDPGGERGAAGGAPRRRGRQVASQGGQSRQSADGHQRGVRQVEQVVRRAVEGVRLRRGPDEERRGGRQGAEQPGGGRVAAQGEPQRAAARQLEAERARCQLLERRGREGRQEQQQRQLGGGV